MKGKTTTTDDIVGFLQYILEQWELDTRDIQDRAGRLLGKIKEGE